MTSLLVLSPGPLALIQDLGRPGHADLGVGPSGPADRRAHALANRLLANPPQAAGVEITLGGFAARVCGEPGDVVEVALTGAHTILRVDGIAFDKYKNRLYVGNLDYGKILRVGIDCHGEPGDVEVWVDDFASLAGADGIAFDDNGSLFVAVNGQDSLVQIDKYRHVNTIAEGGLLDAPSSLVFGATYQSRKTLYIASFAITRAFGIFPGTPQPALLKLPVAYKGLPL